MSQLRDRSLLEPDTDTPFDHRHGKWVRMDLTDSRRTTRGRSQRQERTYTCPTCGYELTESEPVD